MSLLCNLLLQESNTLFCLLKDENHFEKERESFCAKIENKNLARYK